MYSRSDVEVSGPTTEEWKNEASNDGIVKMQETNDPKTIVGNSLGCGKHRNLLEGPIANHPFFLRVGRELNNNKNKKRS